VLPDPVLLRGGEVTDWHEIVGGDRSKYENAEVTLTMTAPEFEVVFQALQYAKQAAQDAYNQGVDQASDDVKVIEGLHFQFNVKKEA
jgi:hypothetical protein